MTPVIKQRIRVLISLIVVASLLTPGPISSAARVMVYDRDSLKEELKKDGNRTIELMENVTIRSTMKVCGHKVLTGPGEIKRAIARESAFGGSLFRLASGSLTLKNITINGRGDARVLKGKLYGQLVQVDGGQLTIGSGAVLKNNKNSSRLSDGGGAVRVRSGGACVLNGGCITGNVCITGGAGIRIDSGGVCSIKSGSISGNKTVGKGTVEGFDGRGGAIYNKGTLAVYGGSITGNTVSGFARGGRRYGGVGGGIANAGKLLLQGGSVTSNHGSKGADIGLIKGQIALNGNIRINECWMKNGRRVHVGKSYKSGSRLKLIPETVKEGVKLADGLSGKSWKKRFSYPSSIKEKGLKVSLKNGVLVIKKMEIKKNTPTPTGTPKSGTGGDGSGSKRVPVASGTPRPHPSYIPVRQADPMAEIILSTPSSGPTVVPYYQQATVPHATPTEIPTASPNNTIHTAVPTRVPTPAPTPVRPLRTLPFFFLFPQAVQEVRPEETYLPVEWRFTKRDINIIKKEIQNNDERVSGVLFLRRIRGNIVVKE